MELGHRQQLFAGSVGRYAFVGAVEEHPAEPAFFIAVSGAKATGEKARGGFGQALLDFLNVHISRPLNKALSRVKPAPTGG
ncbi:hypothetical protein D3C85_1562390 [compost metagenome]